MAETLFFIGIVLVLAWCQLMLMSMMWHRLMHLISVQDPRTTRVVIHAFGADTKSAYRALARHTRLDLNEIDEMLEQQTTGPLPVLLSSRNATLLAADLRAAGADVEIVARREVETQRRGGVEARS